MSFIIISSTLAENVLMWVLLFKERGLTTYIEYVLHDNKVVLGYKTVILHVESNVPNMNLIRQSTHCRFSYKLTFFFKVYSIICEDYVTVCILGTYIRSLVFIVSD